MILKVTRSEASEKTYHLTLENCGVDDVGVRAFSARIQVEVAKEAFLNQPVEGDTYVMHLAKQEPTHEEASPGIQSSGELNFSAGGSDPSESGGDVGSSLAESFPGDEEGQLPAEPSEVTELVPPREPTTDPDVAEPRTKNATQEEVN